MATQERFRSSINNNLAQRQVKGRRTGARIFSQQDNGIENAHDLFTAPSPPTEVAKENPVQALAKFTRFSIGGNTSQKSNDESAAKKRTKRMMGRLKGNRGIASPSELSRVSTASKSPKSPLVAPQKSQRRPSPKPSSPASGINSSPPAPAVDDDYDDPEEEEEEEVPTQVPSPSDDEEEEEKKKEAEEEDDDDGPPLPDDQEEEEEEEVDEEEEEDVPMVEQNDTQTEASVVEDDMLPPAPPDTPERDDESEIPSQKSRTQDFLDESEDEDDSPAYSMPTTKTPQSAKALRHDKKKRKKLEKAKKSSKKRKKVQVVESSDEEGEEEVQVKPQKKAKKTKNRFATVFTPKGIPLPREYETVPVEDLRETDETRHNGVTCRRSKRARCPPLAYWKNEKLQYGPSDDMDANSDVAKMPVPKAVIKAKSTPYKPRTIRRPVVTASTKNKGKSVTIPAEEARPAEFDSKRLRKKYNYLDEEETDLWDEHLENSAQMKVVAFKGRELYHELPVGSRSKADGNVGGKAAQVFTYNQPEDSNFVGYIMGRLVLPPKGIKDSESVGECTQVFTVLSGQKGAVEVAYADPSPDGELRPESALRFLLGPGDMFRVPPGNCYRLHNHSKTTECSMTWTIIRPDNRGREDGGSQSHEEGDSQSR